MDPNVLSQPRYPTTCIPSLMPPGVDPSSVDFRTFFPYIPNEVKHRKRTSRHQLKVLEDVFRKDTKPNAVLRKKLAAELEMSPRAVQVWFQNRRAKEKAQRKRVTAAADQDKSAPSPAVKKSPPSRDVSPNDSSNSSTPTEKPACHTEGDVLSGLPPAEPSTSPVLKLSCSPPLLPQLSPPWTDSLGASFDVPPHVRPPNMLDPSAQDPDLYNARRGSLPTVMPSQPFTAPNLTPSHPDRRKSMDVNFYRLMQHPFARIAKEKNEALFMSKSPLSPAGSTQANMTRSSGLVPGIGPIRSNGHGYRPTLSHRASEPQVFAPVRTPFPPVPETGPLQSHPASSRRFSDNRLYAITSRPLTSPIPGPLPTPDFQFGNPSSGSPSNGSPTPGEVESSPPVPLQSPDIAQLQRWSFPRSRETDQDTEDSGSYCALSRFGSVASISGSDSSAVYSDVSSCVDHMAYDPSTRRGSCASGGFLEMRLSGLSMTSRSSQGSLNEAHLAPPAALAYRDKLARPDHSSEMIGGYVSPASTASPGASPHVRQVKDSAQPSVLRNEGIYDCGPLSQVPEGDEMVTRRGSIQVQEPLPQLYVPGPLELQTPFPTSPADSTSSVQPSFAHGGNFIPPSTFSHSGEPSFVPTGSAQTDPAFPQQASLQYSPQAPFSSAPNAMTVPHTMSRYAPPANDFTYTASQAQEAFSSLP